MDGYVFLYIMLFVFSGAVYRGKYRHENIAIKEFLTQSQAESGYDEYDDPNAIIPQVSRTLLSTRIYISLIIIKFM